MLDHFDLDVAPGDVLALVGRSGAGKTTLLKLVNRLLLPDAGAVIVEGRDTRDWEPIRLRRRVGYVLQDVGLFPHMTVADNIGVVPRLEGWPRERIAARVARAARADRPRPATFGGRWPDELSGGQRQRVGVARALAVDPPVLLMDEPFGALDPMTRAELHAEFRRIQDRLRKTVIIVTHDMGEAFALGDRIGVLDDGRLVACDRRGDRRALDGPARARAARRRAVLPRSIRASVLEATGRSHDAACSPSGSSHRAELATLLAQHVLLVAVSTLAAVAIGVPLGIFAARRPRLGAPLVGDRQHRADDAEPRDVRLSAAGAAHRRRRRARRRSSC